MVRSPTYKSGTPKLSFVLSTLSTLRIYYGDAEKSRERAGDDQGHISYPCLSLPAPFGWEALPQIGSPPFSGALGGGRGICGYKGVF